MEGMMAIYCEYVGDFWFWAAALKSKTLSLVGSLSGVVRSVSPKRGPELDSESIDDESWDDKEEIPARRSVVLISELDAELFGGAERPEGSENDETG